MKTSSKTAPLTSSGALLESHLTSVLGYQMAQASVTMVKIFDLCVGGKLGLHRLEYTILMLIRDNPNCSAKQLANALSVSTPNIASWLDRVRAKGWVSSEPSSTDRRAIRLQLTDQGLVLVARATHDILSMEAEVLSGLSAAERAMLGELLHKVASVKMLPHRN